MLKKKYCILIILGAIVIINSSAFSAITLYQTKTNSLSIETTNGVMCTKVSNVAYFGEIWSLNKENSFGAADLSLNRSVKATWETDTEIATGYIQMIFASLIANRTEKQLSTYRLSSYKIIIHDGPSTSDPILYEGEKEVLENSNDIIGQLIFPASIETKGKQNRTLAIEAYSETAMISNVFNVPLIGKNGQNHETGFFDIDFNNPQQLTNDRNDAKQPLITYNRSITIDLGTIRIYSTTNRSNVPKIDMSAINRTSSYILNRSQMPYEVTVTVDYIVDLKIVPNPNFLSKLFGIKAELDLEGGYNILNRTSITSSALEDFRLSSENLNRTGKLNRTFMLEEEPTDLVFMVSCDLLSSTPKFNITPFANSFESRLCISKLKYT